MFYAFLSKVAGTLLILVSLLLFADAFRLLPAVTYHLQTQADLVLGLIFLVGGRLVYGFTTMIYIGGSRRSAPYCPPQPQARMPSRQIVEHIHRFERTAPAPGFTTNESQVIDAKVVSETLKKRSLLHNGRHAHIKQNAR